MPMKKKTKVERVRGSIWISGKAGFRGKHFLGSSASRRGARVFVLTNVKTGKAYVYGSPIVAVKADGFRISKALTAQV